MRAAGSVAAIRSRAPAFPEGNPRPEHTRAEKARLAVHCDALQHLAVGPSRDGQITPSIESGRPEARWQVGDLSSDNAVDA